jgi:site-specific DNA recombinase
MSIYKADEETKKIKYNDYPYIVYVRVSTDKDEQKDSVPNQVEICRYWLEKNGFEWDERSILMDEAKSGTEFLERTAMQLILSKARQREIKMVVFKSIHRLARDLKDSLDIKETIIGHGARLVTLEEGYDSFYEGKNDMKFEMYAMFAAQYPKTLSASVSAVLSSKVRNGIHIGKVPYGYYRNKEKKLSIKEDEAKVIRRIFKWYNKDGFGYKSITNLLNEGLIDGTILPPRTKDKWQVTSVQRIIQNPTYCGTYIANQYTKIKVAGRKKQIRTPKHQWTIYENHHPAIISKEEWEKASGKERPKYKTRIAKWNEFRTLLRCSKCGANMVTVQSFKRKKDGTRTEWKYLKCSEFRRGGNYGCINHEPIRYEEFREFVLKRLLRKGKSIKLNFENSLEKRKTDQLKQLEKAIQDLEEKKRGLVDLYLDKLILKDEFEERRDEFDSKIKKAQDKIFILNKEETVQLEIKDIQQAFKELENKDQDLHHALKTLIDHIVVHRDGKIDIKYSFGKL